MFGIGTPELILIFILALIVLGPAKLPEIAKTVGRTLAGLRRQVEDVKKEIHLDEFKHQIEEEAGLDELRRSLDVRGEIRRAIDLIEEPVASPPAAPLALPAGVAPVPPADKPPDDRGGLPSG